MNSDSSKFKCRGCGGASGELVLDLGVQPLANNLLRAEDLGTVEPRFPLRLFVCLECWLLQIADLMPPVELFSDYAYFSSFSDAMLEHARKASERYTRQFGLGKKSRVVEIASNDGYLFQNFQRARIPCLGIEPAANIAAVAREKGIETVTDFFSSRLADQLAAEGRQADLILGNNVFAHVPDSHDFLDGTRKLLRPGGRMVLEFPYAVDLIEKTEFDTIYHEHVFYFTLTALEPLLIGHGMEMADVERIPIHGGSLRLFVGRAGDHARHPRVGKLLADERNKGVGERTFYQGFAREARGVKRQLIDMLGELKTSGRHVAAYGASAKGSTLLNYCGLGRDWIDFVVDRSSHKQGRFTPGTQLPVLPPGELLERMPDYSLLLTWNFAEEILKQQRAYRERGGRFIVPIPKPAVI